MDHRGFNSDEERRDFLEAVGVKPFPSYLPTGDVGSLSRINITATGLTREDAIAHALRVLALIVTSPKSKACDTSCPSGNATAEWRIGG